MHDQMIAIANSSTGVTDADADSPSALTLVADQWRDGPTVDVRDPYRQTIVGSMVVASSRDCDDALVAAHRARSAMADMPGYQRAELLHRIADSVGDRAEHIAYLMARETGKAIKDCRTEVQRSLDIFRLCAGEAVRIQGEHVPMDGSALGAGKLAMLMRHPVGVVAAITPFNGPVQLASHKVGPAFAAGNSVVLKPSPKAPLCTHAYVEAILAAGPPAGSINVLHGDAVSAELVADRRVDFVSFTGSIPVGRAIRNSIGLKRAALELGGVGPTFVAADADLQAAAAACARNGVMLAGQSCASVQNVFVHHDAYAEFVDRVQKEIATINFGDPMDPLTDVGTLIDEPAAVRVMGMIDRAVDQGATVLCGGHRDGAQIDATILTGVQPSMDITAAEIFGPALTVQPYREIEPIFQNISESPFGLQCGIFTNSLDLALKAIRTVRTGGVIVNATSRWRSDQMPYGGVKDSGIGREGPKFAIREMTEERLFVLN